jgi:cyclophilin family peptidyl-prolyl cis-trans isomerase
MKNWTHKLLAALAFTSLLVGCGGGGGDGGTTPPVTPPPVTPPVVPPPQVTVTVSNGAGLSGNFVITLSPTLAPVTTANFLAYVNAGFYTGTVFHRHSPNFVLQGGGFAGPMNPSQPVPALKATSPAIALEVGRAGQTNVRWSVAMARTNVLNSATSQFFINLVDNVFLDTSSGGYAVFGNVTAGTDFITTALTGPCVAYPALQAAPDCLFVPNLTVTSAVQTR